MVTMRILVFGDSITYGKVDTQGGWAERLRQYFDIQAAKDYSRDLPNVYNLGISGDTAEGILMRFDIEAKARSRDEDLIFIVAVGTNDSSLSNGKPLYTENDFEANLENILKKAKKYSSKLLLVGLLPVNEKLTTPIPWRLDRHYTNKQIVLFDEIVSKIARKNDIPYVPLLNKFKDKLDLFPDGLHPNDEGHQLIFEQVKPELDKLVY